MSRQHDAFIQSQLEPTQVLIAGNAKRWGLFGTTGQHPVVEVCPPESEPKCYGNRWEDERERGY